MQKDTYIKTRHNFTFSFFRPPVGLGVRILYNYREKKFRLKKGEQYLILANHQSVLDPVMVCMSFNRPVYIVASDTLFKDTAFSALLSWLFAPIPKRKAATDMTFIKTMRQVAGEGGNLLIFPEGNRAWADYQVGISSAISKMIKLVGLPVILYNIKGGYGVNPRWGKKLRRGRMTGEVSRILNLDEIKSMTNEELHSAVVEGLRVIDSDEDKTYRSNRRAEHLERELFICPACKKQNTLFSEKNKIRCSCGAVAEYTENLRVKSENNTIPFDKLVDWYKFQLEEIKKMPLPAPSDPNFEIQSPDDPDAAAAPGGNTVIFSDGGVTFFDQSGNKRGRKIGKGTLSLTRDALIMTPEKNGRPQPPTVIPMAQITHKSVVGGIKLLIGTAKAPYFIVGHKRFNALKYALILNRLETSCKEDIYYGLSI